jgi:hypothetical protein
MCLDGGLTVLSPTIQKNGNMTTITFPEHPMSGARDRVVYFSYETLIGFQTSEGKVYIKEDDWSQETVEFINSITNDLPTTRLSEKDFKQAYKELF